MAQSSLHKLIHPSSNGEGQALAAGGTGAGLVCATHSVTEGLFIWSYKTSQYFSSTIRDPNLINVYVSTVYNIMGLRPAAIDL